MEESKRIARLFHKTYERLAPEFGYKTREDTREFDENSPNGKLMIAVCKEVVLRELNRAREEMIMEIYNFVEGESGRSGRKEILEFISKLTTK